MGKKPRRRVKNKYTPKKPNLNHLKGYETIWKKLKDKDDGGYKVPIEKSDKNDLDIISGVFDKEADKAGESEDEDWRQAKKLRKDYEKQMASSDEDANMQFSEMLKKNSGTDLKPSDLEFDAARHIQDDDFDVHYFFLL